MGKVQKSIVVDVPVHTVYNQWTQFEDFPKFMEGVEQVQQVTDKNLHWKAKIGGKTEEWNAEITRQVPDNEIAWHSTTGAPNSGDVTFQPEGTNRTRVTLMLDFEPQGAVEKAGSALGIPEHQVEGNLKRFKQFIESRGHETGAWRGEIKGGTVEDKG